MLTHAEQVELSGLEASATLMVRCWYRDVPEDPGPVPWVPEKIQRMRELRNLPDNATVSIVVPRKKGVVAVPLTEEATEY